MADSIESNGQIDHLSKDDFDQILAELEQFWGDAGIETIFTQHASMLFHEFGDTAFVVREGNQVIAYMFGLVSQTEPIGYVHLIAVREGYRRKGLAKRLYAHFERVVRARDCKGLKAIAMPWNEPSIKFHQSVGLEPVGIPNADGNKVIKDYRGPGKDRVVLRKRWD